MYFCYPQSTLKHLFDVWVLATLILILSLLMVHKDWNMHLDYISVKHSKNILNMDKISAFKKCDHCLLCKIRQYRRLLLGLMEISVRALSLWLRLPRSPHSCQSTVCISQPPTRNVVQASQKCLAPLAHALEDRQSRISLHRGLAESTTDFRILKNSV